jgi:glycosyltransferase involved in cell wall biosynthesis
VLPRMPLVSILTPSKDQGRWISQNIASVDDQTYPTIEHIVVDGGSTDETLSILQSADTNTRRWSSAADRGQSQAINRAYRSSSGEIIGWLNSDDAYFSRDAVSLAVDAFLKYPSVAVVYGHAALVSADGLLMQTIWVPKFSYQMLRLHDFLVQPAAFIRRSALDSDFMVDEEFDYTMDYELWLRLGARHAFYRVPRVLAIDRHHLNRKSYTRRDVAAANRLVLNQRYGVHISRRSQAVRKLWKVSSRAMGVGLLSDVVQEPLAVPVQLESMLRLAVRQVAVPRRWMPGAGA